MTAKSPGASAPVPQEPSGKISGVPYLSDLLRELFNAAKPNLSRNDFETIAEVSEIGILSLRNLHKVVETIGCDIHSGKHSNAPCRCKATS